MCAPIKETCLIGPDTIGNFATSEVQPSYAETCDRDKCTCSSHDDYAETATERLATAIAVHSIQQGKQFDSGIDESLIIDADAPQPEKEEESSSDSEPDDTTGTSGGENTTPADETTTQVEPVVEPPTKVEEEEEKPKIEDFADPSDFIDALIDSKIQDQEKEEEEEENAAGTDFGTVNLSDLSFNGYNLLESDEKIGCIIGGKDVVIEITLMQYEIMCK